MTDKENFQTRFWPIVISDIGIHALDIVDTAAISTYGVIILSGISLYNTLADALKFMFVAVGMFIYSDYNKKKNNKAISEYLLLMFLSQMAVTLLALLIFPFIILSSGISAEAKQVAFVCISIGGINCFIQGRLKVFDMYLVANNKASGMAKRRLTFNIIGITLDIIIVLLGLDYYLIIFATLLVRICEHEYAKRLTGLKKLPKSKISDLKQYLPTLKSTSIESFSRRIMYILSSYFMTFTGDTIYAIYSIVKDVIYSTSYSAATADNICAGLDVKETKQFCQSVKNDVLKYAALSTFYATIVSLFYTNYNLNFVFIGILSFIMAFTSLYGYIFLGLCRSADLYKINIKIQNWCTVFIPLFLFLTLPCKNVYLYSSIWIIRFLITILLASTALLRFDKQKV